jgi:toxin ParE1/3/4
MKLRFTPRALENIAHIADYLHARNPSAVQRVRDDIYDGLRNLILFPQVGRLQQTKGVRKLVRLRLLDLLHRGRRRRRNCRSGVKHPAQKREHDDA